MRDARRSIGQTRGRLSVVLGCVLLAIPTVWATNLSLPVLAASPPAAGNSISETSSEAAPGAEHPGWVRGNLVGVFENVRVPAGQVRRGDVVCVFADAEVEGEVVGDIVVVGGNLRLAGQARRDVVAVLSNTIVEPGAVIHRSLQSIMGSLDNQGTVLGDTARIPLPLAPMRWKSPFGAIGSLVAWGALLWTVLTFLLLLLLAALAGERIRVISEEVPVSYVWAILAGLGGYVALWVTNLLLILTLVGIPLVPFVYLAFVVVKWLGLGGVYHFVGRSIGRLFRWDLSPLPAILVGFLPFALLQLLPLFVGGFGFLIALGFRFLFWVLVEIPAVGLALITRLGTRPRKLPSPPITDLVVPVPPVPAPPPTPATS